MTLSNKWWSYHTSPCYNYPPYSKWISTVIWLYVLDYNNWNHTVVLKVCIKSGETLAASAVLLPMALYLSMIRSVTIYVHMLSSVLMAYWGWLNNSLNHIHYRTNGVHLTEITLTSCGCKWVSIYVRTYINILYIHFNHKKINDTVGIGY